MNTRKPDRSGVSTIEYVLLLAGIVVAVLIALPYLSDDRLAFLSQLNQNLADNGRELVGDKSRSGINGAEMPARMANSLALKQMGFALGAFMLGCAIPVFIFLRRRQKQKAEFANACKRKYQHRPKDENVVRRRMEEKRNSLNRILRNQWETVVKAEIRVGDLMTTKLITVQEDDLTESIESKLLAEQVHHVLVEDSEGRFRGIISDRDLQRRPGKTAGEVMTADPMSVNSDTDIKQVLTMILINGFSSLPIVDDGKLVGIVTTNDLIATLHCTLVRLVEFSQLLGSETGRGILSKTLQDIPARCHS